MDLGRRDIGGIQNTDRQPQPGDRVKVGEQLLEIVEIVEPMPPRGDSCLPACNLQSGVSVPPPALSVFFGVMIDLTGCVRLCEAPCQMAPYIWKT